MANILIKGLKYIGDKVITTPTRYVRYKIASSKAGSFISRGASSGGSFATRAWGYVSATFSKTTSVVRNTVFELLLGPNKYRSVSVDASMPIGWSDISKVKSIVLGDVSPKFIDNFSVELHADGEYQVIYRPLDGAALSVRARVVEAGRIKDETDSSNLVRVEDSHIRQASERTKSDSRHYIVLESSDSPNAKAFHERLKEEGVLKVGDSDLEKRKNIAFALVVGEAKLGESTVVENTVGAGKTLKTKVSGHSVYTGMFGVRNKDGERSLIYSIIPNLVSGASLILRTGTNLAVGLLRRASKFSFFLSKKISRATSGSSLFVRVVGVGASSLFLGVGAALDATAIGVNFVGNVAAKSIAYVPAGFAALALRNIYPLKMATADLKLIWTSSEDYSQSTKESILQCCQVIKDAALSSNSQGFSATSKANSEKNSAPEINESITSVNSEELGSASFGHQDPGVVDALSSAGDRGTSVAAISDTELADVREKVQTIVADVVTDKTSGSFNGGTGQKKEQKQI